MDAIKEILLAFVLALLCAVLAAVLKDRKAWILAQLAELVQRAETAVQGSGMGAEKKRIVIAQLEAMGVQVRAWMSTAIDNIVAALNEKQAWLTENAGDGLSEANKSE